MGSTKYVEPERIVHGTTKTKALNVNVKNPSKQHWLNVYVKEIANCLKHYYHILNIQTQISNCTMSAYWRKYIKYDSEWFVRRSAYIKEGPALTRPAVFIVGTPNLYYFRHTFLFSFIKITLITSRMSITIRDSFNLFN